MKIGNDYTEICSCGAQIAIADAWPTRLKNIIGDWRQNHICPNRPIHQPQGTLISKEADKNLPVDSIIKS
ncbi:MAG: hypothetical protein ACYS1A_15995 [Planctomycetota bacterium]|jgi:hypothetical protein